MTGKFPTLAVVAAFLATFARPAAAQCRAAALVAFGPGGTYYINPASDAPFSFQGQFTGCVQEQCQVSLNLPSGTSPVGCGSISSTNPDWEAVCSISHNNMKAGVYSNLIVCPKNGIQFGALFTIVNTQVTTTTTTTETVTGTATPVSTVTSTISSTETDTSTLVPVTVTIANTPSATVTIHPSTTITKTKTYLKTVLTATTVSIIKTKTVTPHCTTAYVFTDHTAKPTATSSSSASKAPRSPPHIRRERAVALAERDAQPAKRVGIDGPLTTTVTVSATPKVILVTGPATTIVITSTVLSTTVSTVTPPPQTVFKNPPAFTKTAPTVTYLTKTRLHLTTTLTATKTIHLVLTVLAQPTTCPF